MKQLFLLLLILIAAYMTLSISTGGNKSSPKIEEEISESALLNRSIQLTAQYQADAEQLQHQCKETQFSPTCTRADAAEKKAIMSKAVLDAMKEVTTSSSDCKEINSQVCINTQRKAGAAALAKSQKQLEEKQQIIDEQTAKRACEVASINSMFDPSSAKVNDQEVRMEGGYQGYRVQVPVYGMNQINQPIKTIFQCVVRRGPSGLQLSGIIQLSSQEGFTN